MLLAALCLYLVNVGVGVGAQVFGLHFGIWHHRLYAMVFASAIATAVLDFRYGLLVTLLSLAVFPFAKPRTTWHPALAIVGLAGYGLALLDKAV